VKTLKAPEREPFRIDMTNDTDPCTRPTLPAPAGWEAPPESSRYIELPDAPRVCTQPTWPAAKAVPAVGDSLEALQGEWIHSATQYDWGTYVLLKTGVCLERHESARADRLKTAAGVL
jgi:hypothetical protein